MCGIVFAKAERAIEIFNMQTERGLDGLGLITFNPERKSYKIGPPDEYAPVSAATYTKMYDAYCEKHSIEGNVLLHHRKASIGHKNLENAHPYVGSKFYIMQNGTAKDMRTWGDIEFIPASKSDTYCFLQYLEHHCNTLDDVIGYLNFAHWTIGSIFICDFDGNVLFYSDKTRESYITKTETEVTCISSKNPDDLTAEYYCEGYMIFNMDGTILSEDFVKVNEKKYVAPIRTWTPVSTYTTPTVSPRRMSEWERNKLFIDADDIRLFLVRCDGMLSKKINKLFPIAYDAFMKDVDPVLRKYSTVNGVYESDKDRASRIWEHRHKKVVEVLHDDEIFAGCCGMAELNKYNGVLEFRKKFDGLLSEVRKGRISKRNVPALPAPALVATPTIPEPMKIVPSTKDINLYQKDPEVNPNDSLADDPDQYYRDLEAKYGDGSGNSMDEYLEGLDAPVITMELIPGHLVHLTGGAQGIVNGTETLSFKGKDYHIYTDVNDNPGARYIAIRKKQPGGFLGFHDYTTERKYILSVS